MNDESYLESFYRYTIYINSSLNSIITLQLSIMNEVTEIKSTLRFLPREFYDFLYIPMIKRLEIETRNTFVINARYRSESFLYTEPKPFIFINNPQILFLFEQAILNFSHCTQRYSIIDNRWDLIDDYDTLRVF